MTTHADGMTAAGDDSRRAAGGTGASGDRATFQAQPGTLHGFDQGMNRRRESLDVDTETTSGTNVIEHARPFVMIGDKAPVTGSEGGPGVVVNEEAQAGAGSNFDDHEIDLHARLCDPSVQQQKAFALIKAVRKLVPNDETQSKQTHADYTVIAKRLEKTLGHQFDQPGTTGCRELLDSYAGSPRTFRLYKAAVCWFMRQRLRQALAEQDRLQRSGQYDDAWVDKVMVLGQLAVAYRGIKKHQRNQEAVAGSMEFMGESKRLDLPIIKKKFKDWNKRVLAGSLGGSYVDVIHAMDLFGPRPVELKKGVVVALEPAGEASITIQGAKVDQIRGQPWRKIFFPLVDLPPEWQHRLQEAGSFVVSITSTDGLRSALHRISERVLPNVPAATAYIFRHAVATRLRRQGFSSEEIGAFLGHSAAITQTAYGFKSSRIKGGQKLRATSSIRISVPRPVRPQDLSGLKPFVDAKATAKSRRRQP